MPENQYCPQIKLGTFREHLDRFCRDDPFYPVLVELSPSLDCNGGCDWCFYRGTHAEKYIDFDIVRNLFRDLSINGVSAVNITGEGEPTTHPRINEIIGLAHDSGLKIGLFTNGFKSIAHPEQLEWIRVSITQSMRFNSDTVSFYAAHTNTGICFNYKDEYNLYAERICSVARESGAHHIQIRPALFGPFEKQEHYEVPVWLKEYETNTFKVIFPEYKWTDYVLPHGYKRCYGHYFCPSITHDGNVNVCMYHLGDAEFTFGNLYRNSFSEIWSGPERKRIISGMRLIGCQRCCKNHEINKMLYAVKHPESVKHREFL